MKASAGLYACIPLKKLLLTRKHGWMRLRWARTHHRWTLTQAQWIHVMFSDEARFKTD